MIGVAIVALCISGAAHAEDAGGTVRHHVAQARQFVKNKWYTDAAAEIEAALAAPGGDESFDAAWLGAQVYYELVDIDRAGTLAERAAALAPNADAREQAANYSTFLHDTFGFVEVRGPQPGMRSRLQIERTSVLFDADLKRLLNVVAVRVHEPTALPARIALPAGDYLVNGVAVSVAPGGTATVALDMRQVGARGIAALQVTRLEIAGGTAVLFGDRMRNLRPGGAFELSLTQPVGPLLLGAVGTFDLRSYGAAGSEQVTDLHAFGGGLRVGHEFAVGGPLSVRPSLGVRYGLVPGVAFSCVENGGELACVPLDGVDRDVEVYAVGRAITPYAELSVEYRAAGRTTALGVGVKAVVEEHVGTVVNPGDAAVAGEASDPLPYTASPPGWTATGVRLLFHTSIAF